MIEIVNYPVSVCHAGESISVWRKSPANRRRPSPESPYPARPACQTQKKKTTFLILYIYTLIHPSTLWFCSPNISTYLPFQSPFSFWLLVPVLSSLVSSLLSPPMLSTLRVAGRQAASREANLRTVMVGARYASTWSNVPQGPPVSVELGWKDSWVFSVFSAVADGLICDARMLSWVSLRRSRPTPSRRRSTWALALTVRNPNPLTPDFSRFRQVYTVNGIILRLELDE
jgi:hypothetical protein